MATEQAPPIMPGEVIQDANGHLYLASEIHRWGVGALMRWTEGGQERESYHRLKAGQFVRLGPAHTVPKEIAQRRADAIAHQAELDAEAGQ